MAKKKLIKLKDGTEKCPTCGTKFIGDKDPHTIEVLKRLKKQRSSLIGKAGG